MEGLPLDVDLFTIPFQQPPDGVTPDYTKRSDLLDLNIAIITIMIFLMSTIMILRISLRLQRDESWKMDDLCAIATWITTSTLGIALCFLVKKIGKHPWDVTMSFLISAWCQRMLVSTSFLVALSLFLGKCSLLALYYRFFGHITRVRYQIYATLFLSLPLLSACIVFPVLQAPQKGQPWGVPNPNNYNGVKISLAMGIINLVVDFIILYIPIPIIVNMNLPRKKKTGVLAIFLTGGIAIVADCIIMYYRVQLYLVKDVLRYGSIVSLCSFVEAVISIICSSMPAAAKTWKAQITSSSFYITLRSRLSPLRDTGNTSQSVPSHIKKPESVKKKRRGLYSIGTFPSTNISTAHLSELDDCVDVEMNEFREENGKPRSDTTGVSDRHPQHEAQREASYEQASLNYYNSSNYLDQRSMV